MKKIVVLFLVLIMVLIFAACGGINLPLPGGNNESTPAENSASESGEIQLPQMPESTASGDGMYGYTGNDGADLASVSTENYAEIAAELFGIDIAASSGWTVEKAESPNGVNNLLVTYTLPENTDGKESVKSYFEKTAAVSGGSVFVQEINWDTLQISKGESYSDFDAFFDAKGTWYNDYYNAMWLYDFGEKSVQCSATFNAGKFELSLVLVA